MDDLLIEARRILALILREVTITNETRNALRAAIRSLEDEFDRSNELAARRALRGRQDEPTLQGDFEPTKRIPLT